MNRPCPKCQQLNLPEAAFCHNCAAPLNAPPAMGMPPAQPWPQPGGQVAHQPPAAGTGASQRAIISVVLAGLAFICCGPLAGIPAAILGWMELQAINSGQSPPAGKWMAQVGLWGGIAFTIIHGAVYIIWLILSLMASANPY